MKDIRMGKITVCPQCEKKKIYCKSCKKINTIRAKTKLKRISNEMYTKIYKAWPKYYKEAQASINSINSMLPEEEQYKGIDKECKAVKVARENLTKAEYEYTDTTIIDNIDDYDWIEKPEYKTKIKRLWNEALKNVRYMYMQEYIPDPVKNIIEKEIRKYAK